jgi:hypothetical protein
MIAKVVRKCHLRDHDQAKEDLAYWLSRPPQERIAAVEILRRQHYGPTGRLQRIVKRLRLGES